MKNPQTSSLLNIFLASSFLPYVSKPTRITELTQTLIDNIYTNNIHQETVIKSGTLLEDISDHLPIFCSISTKDATPQALRMIKERIQRINWDYLKTLTVYMHFKASMIN